MEIAVTTIRYAGLLSILLAAALSGCGGGGGGGGSSSGGPGGGTSPINLMDPATRGTIIGNVTTAVSALPSTNGMVDPQQLLTAVKSISGLSNVALAPDNCVIATFADGVPLTVFNDEAEYAVGYLPEARGASSAVKAAAPAPHDIPSGPTALLLDSEDPINFPNRIYNDVSILNSQGYNAQLALASVAEYKQVGQIQPNLLYITAHGGSSYNVVGGPAGYAIWTSDAAVLNSSQPGYNYPQFSVDLQQGTLGYGIAEVSAGTGGKFVYGTHYMILPSFLSKNNWKLATSCPVLLGCCYAGSSNAASMRAALFNAGASIVTGYTGPTYSASSYRSYSYILDRMSGANVIEASTPPHRPFKLQDIKTVLDSRGNDTHGFDKYTIGGTQTEMLLFGPTSAQAPPTVLQPSLQSTSIAGGTIFLQGEFGTRAGKVYVNGTQLTNVQWGTELISATIPTSGPGCEGDVWVTVPFGGGTVSSNKREISEWSGTFTETDTQGGTQYAQCTMDVTMLADVGQYYTAPDATTLTDNVNAASWGTYDPASLVAIPAGPGSIAQFSVDGDCPDGNGGVDSFSQNGTGNVPEGNSNANNRFTFTLGVASTPGSSGRIGYQVYSSGAETITDTPSSGSPTTSTTAAIFSAIRNISLGGQLINVADYVVQFDGQYNIQAGQGSFEQGGDQVFTTTWPSIPCAYPPGQNTTEPR